jgi:hypothetical protein
MNIIAALLGFFVLRPVIKARLSPGGRLSAGSSAIEGAKVAKAA